MIATQTDPFDGARRLNAVQQRIADAARGSGRAVDAVSLLAVSKTFPIEAVDAIADAGQHAFGENYAQEGIEKAVLRPDLEWHFIGPIQSNKTRGIAEHFDWVHTIDRLKIAERLSAQRPADKVGRVALEFECRERARADAFERRRAGGLRPDGCRTGE